MQINTSKTYTIIFDTNLKPKLPTLSRDNTSIPWISSIIYLGVIMDYF